MAVRCDSLMGPTRSLCTNKYGHVFDAKQKEIHVFGTNPRRRRHDGVSGFDAATTPTHLVRFSCPKEMKADGSVASVAPSIATVVQLAPQSPQPPPIQESPQSQHRQQPHQSSPKHRRSVLHRPRTAWYLIASVLVAVGLYSETKSVVVVHCQSLLAARPELIKTTTSSNTTNTSASSPISQGNRHQTGLGTMATPLPAQSPSPSSDRVTTLQTRSGQEIKLAIATRIHLGKASSPPSNDKIQSTLQQFAHFSQHAVQSYVAVQADNPTSTGSSLPAVMSNYSLVDTIRQFAPPSLTILPVSPWGNFLPALNTIVATAARDGVDACLLASAETNTTQASIDALLQHMNLEDTLVVGAVLPGHEYQPHTAQVPLNGRTTPWNTLAVWNIPKLALTGFPLVAEGIHRHDADESNTTKTTTTTTTQFVTGGVEEVSCIGLLQNTLGVDKAKAKLVPLPDVKWEQDFGGDEERRKWHANKMKSKKERPAKHMELLNLPITAYVDHL